jgi:hypothetical protein
MRPDFLREHLEEGSWGRLEIGGGMLNGAMLKMRRRVGD